MRKSVEIYEFVKGNGEKRYDVYLNVWKDEGTIYEDYECEQIDLDVNEKRAEGTAKRVAELHNCKIVRTP